jgi:hypothetical protein
LFIEKQISDCCYACLFIEDWLKKINHFYGRTDWVFMMVNQEGACFFYGNQEKDVIQVYPALSKIIQLYPRSICTNFWRFQANKLTKKHVLHRFSAS